jgi:hypothetical protein
MLLASARHIYSGAQQQQDAARMAHVTQPIVLHERLTPVILLGAAVAFAFAGIIFRTLFKHASKQI